MDMNNLSLSHKYFDITKQEVPEIKKITSIDEEKKNDGSLLVRYEVDSKLTEYPHTGFIAGIREIFPDIICSQKDCEKFFGKFNSNLPLPPEETYHLDTYMFFTNLGYKKFRKDINRLIKLYQSNNVKIFEYVTRVYPYAMGPIGDFEKVVTYRDKFQWSLTNPFSD